MKHPMTKILAAALAVILLTGAAVYAADAGTAEDPLVTLSYMTNTFRQEISELFRSQLDETANALANTMDSQVAALEQNLQTQDTTASQVEDTAWQTVTLAAGQSLTVDDGAQVLFVSGTAAFSGGYAVDTTDGNAAARMDLAANHLYTVSTAGIISGEGRLLLKQ